MSAADLAIATINRLVHAGVCDFVLCPGSRNAPMSLALAVAEKSGRLRLHVRIDERTAAFLALGLAKGSGRPAAVCSTSGTAVANFHPAVVEAATSQTPIVLLTANRPLAMLGTGANQTIPQLGIYGESTRAAVHLDDRWREDWAAALDVACTGLTRASAGPGPVQIDLGFTPPLVPAELADRATDAAHAASAGIEDAAPDVLAPATELQLPPRSLVVVAECAPELACSAVASALAAGFPVHVEAGTALAGARDGCLRAGTFLLRSALVERYRPERLIVVGRPTLSRHIPALIARADIPVTVVAGDPSMTNALRTGSPAVLASRLEISGQADPAYAAAWRTADETAAAVIDAQTAEHFDAGAASAIVADTNPDLLVVASSNPIRDLDERAVRRPQRVVVNRGAAGIDGLVSTAIGAALAGQKAVALLGDLAFLHDSTGLMIGPDEPRPDLTIVVVNNDGGAIFATLEQGAPAYADHFERVFGTPHGVRIGELCAATSTAYQRCDSADALRVALKEPQRGIRVIEVRVSREGERERRCDLADRVDTAIGQSLN